MICHNSVGYDAQIKDLLIKSAFNMNEKEVDVWMKYQYNPQHMFCSGKMIRLLLVFKSQKER